MKKERKCHWLWGHNFDKWIETDRRGIFRYIREEPKEIGIVIIQERECLDCHYKELRKQKII